MSRAAEPSEARTGDEEQIGLQVEPSLAQVGVGKQEEPLRCKEVPVGIEDEGEEARARSKRRAHHDEGTMLALGESKPTAGAWGERRLEEGGEAARQVGVRKPVVRFHLPTHCLCC